MGGAKRFFGWSVAWAAFALAAFAWGIGFYGPSIFLHTLHTSRGWSISQISAAITFHFLLSALLIAYLPEIHRRFGIAGTTFGGAVLMGIGLIGWSGAWQPWQLFVAAVPSAAGWATTSGAALNAIVARWFERDRPKAIGLAFNGASVGGVVFVPLWVFLIDRFGFQIAALSVGATAAGVVAFLSARYFNPSPGSLGLAPDGDAASGSVSKPRPRLSRSEIVRTPRFQTLSAAFALGLFAQIGLLAHLIVRLTPDVGVARAGMQLGDGMRRGGAHSGWLVDREPRSPDCRSRQLHHSNHRRSVAHHRQWLGLFDAWLRSLRIGNWQPDVIPAIDRAEGVQSRGRRDGGCSDRRDQSGSLCVRPSHCWSLSRRHL